MAKRSQGRFCGACQFNFETLNKWYLADEDFSHKALCLLTQYISNEIGIVAPSLIEYEVMNELIIAQKRGRIKEGKILAAIEGFLDLDITLKDPPYFYQKTVHYCRGYNRSIYDASYLVHRFINSVMSLSKYARIPPSFAGGMNGLPSPLGGEG